jgi:4-alpha-glucanotransferase
MAVKEANGGKGLDEWPAAQKDYRQQRGQARYAERAEFWAFVQYCFFKQWFALKAYANGKGIKIIGDRPIYSAYDSAEVWTSPQYFQLDGDLSPVAVAGVPPDVFSKDGQLWGNPLYDWGAIRRDGFSFWTRSLDFAFQMFDVVRIDHFRGFVAYYSIPAGSATAKGGKWVDAPCKEFFTVLKARYGTSRIIAEDLGILGDGVKEMLTFCGFPGMKIFEFAFGERNSAYLPRNGSANSVAYTGTHDNMTCKQWLTTLKRPERRRLRRAVKRRLSETKVAACVRAVLCGRANTAIIPVQDYLELGAEARINAPSTLGGNWAWRIPPSYDTPELRRRILSLTTRGGRLHPTET